MPTGSRGLGGALETVSAHVKTAGGVLLCTDFDGTLAPITERPADARPLEANVRQLRRLRERAQVRVAVVSGRELADLRSRLGIGGITYAGNHGIEYDAGDSNESGDDEADGDETTVHPEARNCLAATRRVRDALQRTFRDDAEVDIEDKAWSVTVHYRRAADDRVPRLRDQIETLVQTVGDGRLDAIEAKRAVEVRPAIDWDKGACVDMLVDDVPADYVPLYVGDDVSDRPGFRTVERRGGVSVGVGRDDAQTRVCGPADVTVLLRWMADTVGQPSHTVTTEQ